MDPQNSITQSPTTRKQLELRVEKLELRVENMPLLLHCVPIKSKSGADVKATIVEIMRSFFIATSRVVEADCWVDQTNTVRV
eukprot:3391950-Amphidinium_carterae.2